MEDYSSNEKVKHEKQRRNIMYNYAFWSVCIIYIHMCNICIKFAISAILKLLTVSFR